MPKITLKETITRKIDISLDTLMEVIDSLSDKEKAKVLSRITDSSLALNKFKKDSLESIISDFAGTDLYEKEFITDLEAGLKKSSVYR